MSLESKRVVVVGDSSGLGLTTARAAEAVSAQVMLASASHSRVQRAVAECPTAVTVCFST